MFVAEDIKAKFDALYAEPRKETLSSTLGIRFTHVERTKLCAAMPVNERTRQPFGLLHGGASVALAETLASVGGLLNVEKDEHVVGLEINANHIRSVREGEVVGTAVPLHTGRRTQVWEIKIVDRDQKLVCVSRCTIAVNSS